MTDNSKKEDGVVWLPSWVGDPKYRKCLELECDYCGSVYESLSEFTAHTLRAHDLKVGIQGRILSKKVWFKRKKVDWLEPCAKFQDEIEYYECDYCHERFMTLRGYSEHAQSVHNVQIRVKRGGYDVSPRKSGLNSQLKIYQGGLPGLGKRK